MICGCSHRCSSAASAGTDSFEEGNVPSLKSCSSWPQTGAAQLILRQMLWGSPGSAAPTLTGIESSTGSRSRVLGSCCGAVVWGKPGFYPFLPGSAQHKGFVGRDRLEKKPEALLFPRKFPDGCRSFPAKESQPCSREYLQPKRSGTSFKGCLDKQ